MAPAAVISILLAMAAHIWAHTYHLGDCPNVEPMPDFNMEKLLGKWYVLQKTSTGSSCLINNYTANVEHPGTYKIEQISEHFLLGLTSYDHKYHYTGDLSVPEQSRKAAMRVQFPLNVIGGASYTVFMSDYNTYAGIFTCQKLAFAHRQSATILSRTPVMDKAYIDKIRAKLSSYGVDPHDLSLIRQVNCTQPTADTDDINIDSDTFSTSSVADAVRKAGEKIGDGVEVVGEGAKKIYNKVVKDDLNEERNAKEDAEWLP